MLRALHSSFRFGGTTEGRQAQERPLLTAAVDGAVVVQLRPGAIPCEKLPRVPVGQDALVAFIRTSPVRRMPS